MCAERHRRICQDTGIVTVFIKWGQQCMLDSEKSLQDVVDEGVRRAYLHPENRLRASILKDPAFSRVNTKDKDRKSVVEGKSVSVRVDLGGRRDIKKNINNNNQCPPRN